MYNKEMALEQINDIYKVLKNNLKTVISGSLMIAIGIFGMLFPVIKWLSQYLANQIAAGFCNSVLSYLFLAIFLLALFYVLKKCFDRPVPKNSLLEDFFNRFTLFFILTNALIVQALTAAGYAVLIMPINFILLGAMLAIWGQFSVVIVRFAAYNIMLAGIVGIYLTKFDTTYLETGLTLYAGLSFIIMGHLLNKQAQQDVID